MRIRIYVREKAYSVDVGFEICLELIVELHGVELAVLVGFHGLTREQTREVGPELVDPPKVVEVLWSVDILG